MQGTQMDIFNNAESEILGSMFGGEQTLKDEFPALYKDMVETQNQAARAPKLRASYREKVEPDGWEDFEKLKLSYRAETKTLTVKGRIHKSVFPHYMVAKLTVKNNGGTLREFSYSVDMCSYLVIDEELTLEQSELDGICAEINYIIRLPILIFPYIAIPLRVAVLRQSMVIHEGIDIIGKGKVIHPVRKSDKSKIDIVYWRRDKKNVADYFYEEPDKTDKNFCVYMPIAMQFELDSNKEIAQNPDVRGDVYIYSKNHGTVQFKNFGEIKLMPASKWDDVSMNRKPGHGKPEQYPEVNEKASRGYVLIFPQHWNNFIRKDGVAGNDDFLLSLDIDFLCTDGERYSLSMESVLKPKKYEEGNVMEIPYMHILWGCLEKTTEVQIKNRGKIQICVVQIGDEVACPDGSYQKVTNIYEGNEEILRVIRVGNKTIRATMDHPIMTRDGWKQARRIMECDEVCMEDEKFCKVDEAYDEPYYDKVYSLETESGEGFLANGFYVGDFNMQNSIPTPERTIDPEILKELEKFKNSLIK